MVTANIFDHVPGFEAEDEDPVEALLAELLDTSDLDNIPALEPLIADVLFVDTVARVYGESGAFKSFMVLDFAACVGTGKDWHGRAARQGTVVYLVAEGVKGIRKRVRAWEQHYGRKMTGVKFLPRPVQVKSPEWRVLIEACRRLKPSLVIVDTQARVTVGVEENSATEMGVILHQVEQLRGACEACVLLVHHSGIAGDRGRGSTSIKGGMQTELGVSRKGKGRDIRVTLSTGKQKDDEELDDLVFALKVVELDGEAKEDGSPVTSVVLLPQDPAEADDDGLTEQKCRIAKTLASAVEPLSQTHIEEHTPGKATATRKALLALVDSGHVVVEPGPRNAKLHRLVRSYPDPVPPSTPSPSPLRPDPVPDGVSEHPVPVPLFKRDGVDGVNHGLEDVVTPSPIKDGKTGICGGCGTPMKIITLGQICHPNDECERLYQQRPIPSSGVPGVYGPGEWAAAGHPGIGTAS